MQPVTRPLQGLRRPLAGTLPTIVHLPAPPDLHSHSVSGAHLYPYQKEGAAWLARRRRALLADEMGLGKTVQVLRALPKPAPAIVVCPASLRLVWRDKAWEWRPDLTVVLSSPGTFHVPGPGELSVVSFESLPALEPDARLRMATVVVDEAQACKDPEARRSRRVRQLARLAARVWLLTGTPMLNAPQDLWGTLLAGGLQRLAFGSRDNFDWHFGGQRRAWGVAYPDVAPHAGAIRAKLARVALRRLRKDVLPDLPSKQWETLSVDVDDALRERLDALGAAWKDEELPPFELWSEVRAELARARIPAMLDHVARFESEGQPLVVWSAHREPILALAGREGWGIVTGEQSSVEQKRAVDAFQAGELRGIGLTIRAGGTGFDLTRAASELFVDLSPTPADNSQAEDRLVRIGQKATGILVARMVADHPVDRRILAILERKQRGIDATTGGSISA